LVLCRTALSLRFDAAKLVNLFLPGFDTEPGTQYFCE